MQLLGKKLLIINFLGRSMGIDDCIIQSDSSIEAISSQIPDLQVLIRFYHNIISVTQRSVVADKIRYRKVPGHSCGETLVMDICKSQRSVLIIGIGHDETAAVLPGSPDVLVTEKTGWRQILVQDIIIDLFGMTIHLLDILNRMHVGALVEDAAGNKQQQKENPVSCKPPHGIAGVIDKIDKCGCRQ